MSGTRRKWAWSLVLAPAVALPLVASLPSADGITFAPATAHAVGLTTVDVRSTCTAPAGQKLQDQDYSDEQLPWRRTNGQPVVINFETAKVTKPEIVEDMRKGVAAWSKSPCIQPRLVKTCQANTNCVKVTLDKSKDDDDDGNFDADEKNKFTVGGHISYYIDKLTKEGPTKTLNVVVHEMGHAVGLRHRKTKNVLMYPDTNDTTAPDSIDYQNLLVLYANQ